MCETSHFAEVVTPQHFLFQPQHPHRRGYARFYNVDANCSPTAPPNYEHKLPYMESVF